MKYFLNLLREYFLKTFNGRLYGATLLWVAFLVAVNFYYDFEDDYIDSFDGTLARSLLYFLVQSLPYYVTCWFIYRFTDSKAFFTSSGFWIISLLGFLILGLTRGNYFANNIALSLKLDPITFNYSYKIIIRVLRIVLIILPLYTIYHFFHKNTLKHFYGLRKRANIRPYIILLLIMVPLVYISSLSPSFLANYPKYKSIYYLGYANYHNLSPQLLVTVYEAFYGLGFVSVELFFRGFLIFGLTRFLGPHVVLPMAVTYCVLHFGKPLGEAISSFFGGYILGVIALKTENIYGGIFVHVGLAWLMELFAWWQMS